MESSDVVSNLSLGDVNHLSVVDGSEWWYFVLDDPVVHSDAVEGVELVHLPMVFRKASARWVVVALSALCKP